MRRQYEFRSFRSSGMSNKTCDLASRQTTSLYSLWVCHSFGSGNASLCLCPCQLLLKALLTILSVQRSLKGLAMESYTGEPQRVRPRHVSWLTLAYGTLSLKMDLRRLLQEAFLVGS